MSIFGTLDVYNDDVPRSAATNMAIDEALFENVKVPSLRLYRWDHPALSFGYFGRYADVSFYQSERELVRRWTGGGIVLHGDDLTYSIVIPGRDSAFAESSMSIYEKIHRALCNAIVATGQHAVVAAVADRGPGVRDASYSGHCFANPVRADVLLDGRKIAGAAQRKTRAGLLQQGSIQRVDLAPDFEFHFARALCNAVDSKDLSENILERANEIADQKYSTQTWLKRR